LRDYSNDKSLAHVIVAITALSFKFEHIDAFDRKLTDHQTVLLRQLAMYLLNTSYNFNKTRIGRVFGKDRTTVAYACQQIEDRRDNETFDDKLIRIEQSLDAMSELLCA